MSTVDAKSRVELRRLPADARKAAKEKAGNSATATARSQFSRTFADVLSGRFGGRWSVEWQHGLPATVEQRRKTGSSVE